MDFLNQIIEYMTIEKEKNIHLIKRVMLYVEILEQIINNDVGYDLKLCRVCGKTVKKVIKYVS